MDVLPVQVLRLFKLRILAFLATYTLLLTALSPANLRTLFFQKCCPVYLRAIVSLENNGPANPRTREPANPRILESANPRIQGFADLQSPSEAIWMFKMTCASEIFLGTYGTLCIPPGSSKKYGPACLDNLFSFRNFI